MNFKLCQNLLLLLVSIIPFYGLANEKPFRNDHLNSTTLQQESITAKGVVSDSKTGEPIPGVNVIEKNTSNGSITNIDGEFTIKVKSKVSKLQFSFIGYNVYETTVGENTELLVRLVEEVSKLDEVVVVGYGQVKKSDLTGSVAIINNKDIQNMRVATITEALSAKTPGISITQNSGSPGKLPNIRIRGVSTITNAQPLYVIDGVPTDPSQVAYLNPNDIEAISVLKDASALAIYGARGGNGIIEITTKKGTKGDMKVNYSMYYGNQEITNFPKMVGGPNFASVFNYGNELQPDNPLYINPDNVYDTNWFEWMSQKATIQNHHLNLSGGNEATTYNLSLGYFDQKGIIKNTYMKRYSIKFSSTSKIKEWIKTGQNVTLTNMDYMGSTENTEWGSGQFYQAMFTNRAIAPYDENGKWSNNPYSNQLKNPMVSIDRSSRVDKDYKLNMNAYIEIQPFIDGLTFKTIVGYNLGISEADDFQSVYFYDASSYRDYPYLFKQFGKSYSFNFDNLLAYQREIGDHSFKVMVGSSSYESNYYNLLGSHNHGLLNENPEYRFFDEYANQQQYALDTTSNKVTLYQNIGGSTPQIDRVMGYLGRVEYAFKGRYLLTANFRRDGSSNFGPGKRFGNFPGFALAWKIHEESFMRNIEAISQLKLRVGWVSIGNDRIPKFGYLDLMNTNMGYSWNGLFAPAASPTQPANYYLHWEKSNTTNLGVDLSLFENKFTLTADAYRKYTDEMLWRAPLNSLSGITPQNRPYANISNMMNQGLELAINYREIKGELTYEVNAHWGTNQNKLLNLNNDNVDIMDGSFGNNKVKDFVHAREGYPVGMFYGFVTEGLFQSREEIETAPFHKKQTNPGDMRFKDLNGDNYITEEDKTFIGNPHPDFECGLNASVAYKGFDLSVSFKAMVGHDIFVAYKVYSHNYKNEGRNYHTDILDTWSEENPDGTMFSYNARTNDFNLSPSDFYVEDGSFLRLQNLTLGYTLPQQLLNQINLTHCRVYVSAQNLHTWSNYLKYGDPDIGPLTTFYDRNDRVGSTNSRVFSVDYVRLPTPRLVSAGIEVSF